MTHINIKDKTTKSPEENFPQGFLNCVCVYFESTIVLKWFSRWGNILQITAPCFICLITHF